jgi:hypothetical protein
MTHRTPTRRVSALAEDGFTMIIAIGVMLITGLLLVAAFTVANGETFATHTNIAQKEAYYAALAGVQEYEYKLQANPDYWEECTGPSSTLPEEAAARYEVTVLPSTSAEEAKLKECSSSNPFGTAIESKGPLANTFRIKSTGVAKTDTGSNVEERTIIATFKVTGFLDFIYYTNYETEDPALYSSSTAASECKEKYYDEWSPKGLNCQVITFAEGDKVDGPMHTNDATRVEGGATFGRKEQKAPADKVEIYQGTYPEDSGEKCTGSPIFYTENKCYEKGEVIVPPPSDESLTAYVKPKYEFKGQTRLILNGTTNNINVVRFAGPPEYKEVKETLPWPENGLIYVTAETCEAFSAHGADTHEEVEETKGCGNVYVSGTYSKSLTVAGANDVIVNGNLYPTGTAPKTGESAPGTATLGLIASEYVRIYHPVPTTYAPTSGKCKTFEPERFVKVEDKKNGSNCEYTNEARECDVEKNLSASEDPNKWGSLENVFVYAAILSTSHSFLVDNYNCGPALGELHVYGAVAQDYRGIVATSGGTGYKKDYEYDGRLATDEPPYFLAPLKAGWKVIRETASSPG